MEDAFANMDDDMEDMKDQENRAKVKVNNLINEVVNEVNLSELGMDTMECKIEELRKQHAEEIREYKTKIFYLKIKLQHLQCERLAIQVVH